MERTRMTKSFSCVGLIACFVLVCIFVSSPQQACGASDSKVYNWRMQTSDPPALMGPTTTVKGFIERVKQMSHGRLDITLFTAGQLVPTMEIFDALGKKTIDIAYTSGVYYTGTVPEGSLELTSLPPLLLPTLKDALQVYWYLGVDQLMRDAYAEKGVYYLGSVFLGDPITNWSKNPMHKASDFVGHKVRSFGYISKTLQKLGATPTLIPHEEVYTALAQGVIDGSLTAGSYYQRLKYYEVCPYYYLPGLIPVPSMCIMVSLKSWNKLPDDLKAILKEAQSTLAIDHFQRLFWEHEQMLKKFDELRSKLIVLPDEEVAKIQEVALSFLPEIAAKSDRCAKGVKIIQDYMRMRGYLK